MIAKTVSFLGNVVTFLGFAAGFVAMYQRTMFAREWMEDHGKSQASLGWLLISSPATYVWPLSDRCRRRRRQYLIALSVFIALMFLLAGIIWLSGSL